MSKVETNFLETKTNNPDSLVNKSKIGESATYYSNNNFGRFTPTNSPTKSNLNSRRKDKRNRGKKATRSFYFNKVSNTIKMKNSVKKNSKYFKLHYLTNKLHYLTNIFKKEFNRNKVFYENLTFEWLENKISKSNSLLVDLKPDIITLELTTEQSVFYTFIKGDYTFHIDYFLVESEEDEAYLNGYKGSDSLTSYSNKFELIINKLSDYLKIN